MLSRSPATKGAAPAFGTLNVVTDEDLKGGTFLTANFYLGSNEATVEVSIDGRRPVLARHTQPLEGEKRQTGWEFADVPAATANLLSTGNVTRNSSSLWRADLPTQTGGPGRNHAGDVHKIFIPRRA